ncbi:hypothetical protein LCGC14_0044670 [marine sediment metagenome]|uniref:Uncharacterized protein n=2 Tax=root TaxID=1 RepID=A0A7V1BHW1_9RHOB|nr:hypothetical protein [Sulfitobacter litoralis]HDZ53512.1 hypothetical protein [Sulfitobacter litoralis]
MDDKHFLKHDDPKPQDWDPTPRWLRRLYQSIVGLFGLLMLLAAWPVFTLESGIRCKYFEICETLSPFGPHAFGTLWPMVAIGLFCIWMAWRMQPDRLKNGKTQNP